METSKWLQNIFKEINKIAQTLKLNFYLHRYKKKLKTSLNLLILLEPN